MARESVSGVPLFFLNLRGSLYSMERLRGNAAVAKATGALGDNGDMVRELAWKKPTLSGRMLQKTPNESHLRADLVVVQPD
jgi:hypothetical protein